MTAPWLSILLPVYRVEAYLPACAASILEQADAGVELVFVDDASPDGSAALIEDLAARDARVRLIRHAQNQGVSAARNTLLDAARGEYLWFVDPDDLMEPGALPRLRALLEQQKPDLVMCDFRAFDDGAAGPSKPRYRHIASFIGAHAGHDLDALLSGLFRAGQLHPWSKIVRRAIWPRPLRFPVGRVFEDLAVYPRLALQVGRFVHVPEVWIGYRQRAGSALSALSAERLDEWMGALEGYAAELPALCAATRFEIAHFCARTFVRACKRRCRLGQDGRAAALRRYERQFRACAPLTPAQLLRAYLRRGRLLRALQLRWWLFKAS